MRKLVYFVGLFVLGSLPVAAQDEGSKDVAVQYSYIRADPSTTGLPGFSIN